LAALPKKLKENKEELEAAKEQRYQDDIDRIAVEGRFGVAKRRYGLGLIKSKLKETSETNINVSILVLNLDKICAEELAEICDKYKIMLEKAS
jgi:transposase, IS5 family